MRYPRIRQNEHFHQHVTTLFSEVNGKLHVACNSTDVSRLKDFSRSQTITYTVKRGNISEIVQGSDVLLQTNNRK